ncbi:MAG: hypothetical protein N2246_11325, partial [Candidatus Sumerlaeia bacterium]|nr:hypothetical protein [Candidatus Sumerlaeia bacterium]
AEGCVECGNLESSTCGDCIVEEGNNPPCQWHPNDPNFGTIDIDLADEFKPAQKAISDFILAVENFRNTCKSFYEQMEAIMEPIEEEMTIECGENATLTGINPAIYSWRDSRCPANEKCHSITVFIKNFRVPRVVKRKYGSSLKGKVCLELVFFTQEVKVTINRQDPGSIPVGAGSVPGLLGRWRGGRISRSSVAKYRGVAPKKFGYVRIKGRE